MSASWWGTISSLVAFVIGISFVTGYMPFEEAVIWLLVYVIMAVVDNTRVVRANE